MGQLLIRQLDDAAIARLEDRARERGTSVEALAREAIVKAADGAGKGATIEEKLELVRRMQEKYRAAMIPGAIMTPGVDLIREDRDR